MNSKNKNHEEAEVIRATDLDNEIIGEEEKKIKGDELEEHERDDYRKIQKLDDYDSREFDTENYGTMSLGQKRRAEEEIKNRERQKKNKLNKNIPENLMDESFSDEQSDDYKRGMMKEEMDDLDQMEEERFKVDQEYQGKLSQWINDQNTVRYIEKTFYSFISKFKDEKGHFTYQTSVQNMCNGNKQSMTIDYKDLSDQFPTIAYWIFESPKLIMGILNQVLMNFASQFFPEYNKIHTEVFVKIDNFPLKENIRDLRTYHINSMVKIRGVITRKYRVFQWLSAFYYVCPSCSDKNGPFYQNENDQKKLYQCANCNYSGGYEIYDEGRIYGNHQKVLLQEPPQEVLPGRVPRSKIIFLLGDNIDQCKPGDMVEILGVYTCRYNKQLNDKHSFPIYDTFIEANYIKDTRQMELTKISQDDIKKIKYESKQPDIFEKVFNSIAPSIYGHHHIKQSVSLALFGGVPQKKDQHVIRGDINILMLGDPGMGKSQFLKYIHHVAHRSVYTTGKGASAVGLTASVKKDPVSGEWCLEGGALVLADTGICLIDEFDKMNEQDRTSIHEAMEQQSISISKASIVATLKARCSVIAAANPFNGKYDDKMSFKDNVDLSDPILSRFDILCVLKDKFDVVHDDKLAEFILSSHMKSHPKDKMEVENDQIGFDQTFLKKYILYAKKNYGKPKLTIKNSKKLENFYVKLRAESKRNSGMNIVVRHLESLVRMSQASAKIHLRKTTTEQDCNVAIQILLNSFIASQKPSVGKQIYSQFKEFLFRNKSTGLKINNILKELINRQIMFDQFEKKNYDEIKQVKVRLDDLKKEVQSYGIQKVDSFIQGQYFKKNYQLITEKIQNKEFEFIVINMQFNNVFIIINQYGIFL